MKIDWTDWKTVAIAVGAIVGLLMTLPKLGDGLAWVGHVAGTTEVAYAAKDTAEDVQGEFHEYITEQRAYTRALNQVIQQQAQQMQIPNQSYRPQGVKPEWDSERQIYWCCDLSDRQACFQQNKWERCQ